MGLFDAIKELLGGAGIADVAESVGLGDQLGGVTEAIQQPLEEVGGVTEAIQQPLEQLDGVVPPGIDVPGLPTEG